MVIWALEVTEEEYHYPQDRQFQHDEAQKPEGRLPPAQIYGPGQAGQASPEVDRYEMEDRAHLVREHLRSHFPEMEGAELTTGQASETVTVYTFRKRFTTPDGASLARVVRISIDREGKIIKVVTSRA